MSLSHLDVLGQRLELLGREVELVDVGQVELAQDPLPLLVLLGVGETGIRIEIMLSEKKRFGLEEERA